MFIHENTISKQFSCESLSYSFVIRISKKNNSILTHVANLKTNVKLSMTCVDKALVYDEK